MLFFSILTTSCKNKYEIPSSKIICDEYKLKCFDKPQKIKIQTSKGNIFLILYAKSSPITVANFIDLVNRDVYQETIFHRVIKEPSPFTVHAGKVLNKDKSKFQPPKNSGNFNFRSIPLEIKLLNDREPRYNYVISNIKDIKNIIHKHKKGSISMARGLDPNSATSQFFLSLNALPILDGRYAVFGEVVDGFDVLELIEVGDSIEKIIHIEN